MKVTETVKYIGVDDHDIDLFEGQYVVPHGMSYNSYVILDEKIAVTDTVDARFSDAWLANLESELGGRTPDYLIIQHTEPDHSASIASFLEKYPDAVVVSNDKAFAMIDKFYGADVCKNRLSVKDGDELLTGEHRLKFIFAPMVHWPEVMVTYDSADKILFSADAFGKFGANDVRDDWTDEARRYYIGIVGKYGAQVQNLLKKAASLDIRTICPLHGPVLGENLPYYIGLYDTWSSYTAEKKGVCICYASVYGNTERAAKILARKLEERGTEVVLHDLARCDEAQAVADAFRYDRLVLASVTYNAGVFPVMRRFIGTLSEHGFKNRTVALMQNGAWAPTALSVMKNLLSDCKNLSFAEESVTINCAVGDDTELAIARLADEFSK